MSTILQLLRLPDGTVKVLVEGTSRARIENFLDEAEYFRAETDHLVESEDLSEKEFESIRHSHALTPRLELWRAGTGVDGEGGDNHERN